MENITFNFARLHEHGGAFYDFLKLRKRFFVDNLGWDIPHDEHAEMDQYDNPNANYSLALIDGRVVGGVRFMPTTAQWGTYSYMLNDAFKGKLIDIPPSVLMEEVRQADIWEGTRIVISDEVNTHRDRGTCLSMIMDGMIEMVAQKGGKRIMSLSPLSMMRALRQRGYDVVRVGEPHHNTGDGRRYTVMSMPAARTLHHVPIATHRPQPQTLHAPSVV